MQITFRRANISLFALLVRSQICAIDSIYVVCTICRVVTDIKEVTNATGIASGELIFKDLVVLQNGCLRAVFNPKQRSWSLYLSVSI